MNGERTNKQALVRAVSRNVGNTLTNLIEPFATRQTLTVPSPHSPISQTQSPWKTSKLPNT